MRTTPLIRAALPLLVLSGTASAQATPLAEYFGFGEPRIIVVDDGMGPAMTIDLDQDGLTDLLVVNDRKSRIEVYRQRRVARTLEEMESGDDVNKLPKSPYYDRVDISVGHAIAGFQIHDVDNDGMLDILYAGVPSEVVYMRQTEPMTFEVEQKRRVRGLGASSNAFNVADIKGDAKPELLTIVEGQVHIYDLTANGVTGEPMKLGSRGSLAAFFIEDYNGDGLLDICAAVPDDDNPVRLWMQTEQGNARRSADKDGVLGPELRFEMPGLIEIEPLRLEGRDAASLAVIERASRRIVLYDVMTEQIEAMDLDADGPAPQRDATAEVVAFASEDDERSIVTADVDANGYMDLLVTDASSNAVVLYRQSAGRGMDAGTSFSAYKQPKAVGAGQWDGRGPLEVFVLSEEEKTVGVSTYNESTDRLGFPQPVAIETPGAAPVAMCVIPQAGQDALGIVVRDRRDHTLEIHTSAGMMTSVGLEGVNRPPQSMLAGEFDGASGFDLLLFTPNEPLVMIVGGATPEVLTDESMPQFGLVQAAGPTNTAMLDVDGDGLQELLIADENFVRACAFDRETGWRVVDQITLPDPSTSLSSLATFTENGRPVIVASDQANKRLVMMASKDNAWDVAETLALSGIAPNAIGAGRFTGDDGLSVIAFSPEAFGVVRLSGERIALEDFVTFRSDEEDRLEHEIEFGDVNSDGYMDMIVLDAREQMCQIFTLSSSRKLFFATEFRVFESRLFNRGDSRTFEPSAVLIDDVTGDGAPDMVLEVHDRYIIFPQMTR